MITRRTCLGLALSSLALPAGARAARASARPRFVREPDGVRFFLGDRPVLRYQAQGRFPRPGIGPEYLRGGYLHPLFTPSGIPVTDDYPANHLHHHGIWTSWAETEFEGGHPDFWNMGKKTGRSDFQSLGKVWQRGEAAGLEAHHLHSELGPAGPRPVLRESWKLVVLGVPGEPPPYFLADLEVAQEAIDKPLRLLEYRYGGFGLRGHPDWNHGAAAASFLTSEGRRRKDGDGVPARWAHLGGPVGGKPVGVAVLGAPDNFRAPQPVRLHPEEPFLSFAPMRQGPFEIRPGTVYRARYRFVVSDGAPDPALLDRLWQDWTHARKPG